MNPEQIREEVRAERREQVTMLAALSPEQWNAPSLCAGWRVREVVAHTTMPFRTSLPRTVWELLRSGGSFNRMADRCARRDAAALTPEQLVASVRDNIDHPWAPPGGGALGALSHDVIHGLDIAVALDLDRTVPPERVGLVLSGMTARQLRFFGVDLAGVALRATDLDWSYGSGTSVHGLAQDLLLAACGRKLPPGRLSGEPAARFSAATR